MIFLQHYRVYNAYVNRFCYTSFTQLTTAVLLNYLIFTLGFWATIGIRVPDQLEPLP